jgi:DNA-binding beta-propeller fold protein YncE
MTAVNRLNRMTPSGVRSRLFLALSSVVVLAGTAGVSAAQWTSATTPLSPIIAESPVLVGPLQPYMATYDPANQNVYVADQPSPGADFPNVAGGVTAITSGNWSKTLSTSCGSGIAYNPDDNELYVSCSTDTVVALDPSNGGILATVAVGSAPGALAYDPANHDIYVTSGDSVSVISPDGNHVVATLNAMAAPTYLTYSSVSQEFYVTQSEYPYGIAVINAVDNSLVTEIPVEAFSATFDPASGDVYAGVSGKKAEVYAINPSNQIVAKVSLGPGNFDSSNGADLAYDPANGNIYAATNPGTSGPNVVSEINSATNKLAGSLPVPSYCAGGGCYDIDSLTYDRTNGDFYVSGPGPYVYIVTSSLIRSQKIPLRVLTSPNSQNLPNREIYDPANGDVYVLCTNYATLVIPITS